jgi:alpha-galactosidase
MNKKITIIGAGSAVFSLNLVRDICLSPGLSGCTVVLMDVSRERLDAIHDLCARYATEVGLELKLEKMTDRREAMHGADAVVNAALAAGHQRLRHGWDIARRFGYRWGGSLHVMHDEAFWINFEQLKLFEGVIEDMLELAPNAHYLQVANPVMAGVTHLARRYPEAKVVGLCHGFGGVYDISSRLGLTDRDRLSYEIPGVNHFVWLTRMRYDGQDVMPLLDEWIEERSDAFWRSTDRHGELNPKKVDLYRRMGAYPIGDTAGDGGGSWGWWYHIDDATERLWRQNPGRFWHQFFTGGEAEVAEIRRISADRSIRVTDRFKPKRSHEVIVPVIESLLCDVPRVVIGNVANRGEYVPGVPRDFAVEVPVLVDGGGLHPQRTAGLPAAPLAYLLRDCVAQVDLELEAFNRRSRRLLLELIIMDPWSRSEEQASALLDGILALPCHADMKEHYDSTTAG